MEITVGINRRRLGVMLQIRNAGEDDPSRARRVPDLGADGDHIIMVARSANIVTRKSAEST